MAKRRGATRKRRRKQTVAETTFGGYWLVPRKAAFSDQLYQEKPYDDWHAWQDIIRRCEFNDTEDFAKGECMVSSYELADDWGWTQTDAARFLRFLASDAASTDGPRIDLVTDSKLTHKCTRVTVRHYERYQSPESYSGWNRLTNRLGKRLSSDLVTPGKAPPVGTSTPLRSTSTRRKKRSTAAVRSRERRAETPGVNAVLQVWTEFAPDDGLPPTPTQLNALDQILAATGGDVQKVTSKARSVLKDFARRTGGAHPKSIAYVIAALEDVVQEGLPTDPAARALVEELAEKM